jgi:GT2 family glycosyltransferase
MDVHTEYASNYVAACVDVLLESGADCVGGAWRVSKPNSGKSRSIALAFDSKIGSGGALSRNDQYSGFCDTVYLGCWRKSYLIEVGLFDEALVRNQDDELCLRIRRLGGKIYQSSEIKSTYFPRTGYTKLFHQWKQYGFWRPLVVKKHKSTGSIRQVVPALFVLSCFAMLLLSFFLSNVYPIVIFTIAYALSIIMVFSVQYPQESIPIVIRSSYAIAIIHFAYGWGFIIGSIFSIGSSEKSVSSRNKISR